MRKLSELSTQVPMQYQEGRCQADEELGLLHQGWSSVFQLAAYRASGEAEEYIIFHEVAHLSELNHSRAFKRRLAAICPDYRERERELDQIVPL